MSNKALYVLAGYDNKTEEYLSSLQNRLYEDGFTGTHTRNIPMHITLGSFPTDKESELTDCLKNISKDLSAFDITFNHIGIFSGGKVLFAAPDANYSLLELKQKFGDIYGWAPHTTIIIDSPDVVYQALPIVMKDFNSFSGKVTSLHLYEFFPTRHILSVNLKADISEQ